MTIRIAEHIWIPLSDGTRLGARLWLPEDDAKVPAVLEYIPYRKRDGTRGRDEPMHGFSRKTAMRRSGSICVELARATAIWPTNI